jgi:D-amino peptidase
LKAAQISLPKHFVVEITYKEHAYATRKSFYPGVERVGSHTLKFVTDDYFEVLRLIAFVL